MPNEEKRFIKDCRILIVAAGEFLQYIKEELSQLGFDKILNIKNGDYILNDNKADILIECTDSERPLLIDAVGVPVIFPFDFIDGAGVIVLFPGDDRNWLEKKDVRQWAAEYMSGYSAFWNVDGCDWLHDALPGIKENRISEAALKTAAYICARIAANIAVGRHVKRYPRFYLCRNLD